MITAWNLSLVGGSPDRKTKGREPHNITACTVENRKPRSVCTCTASGCGFTVIAPETVRWRRSRCAVWHDADLPSPPFRSLSLG